MSTSLARQLARIAADSTDSLNLKAQKAAHSKSLLFDPKDAANQDFDTIFTISHEGFQELCHLDPRFVPFARTIFSEQSKTQERAMMTKAENEELDVVLENFLGLVGGRLNLRPAIKAVDWLVRRFRVHEQNTAFLLLTFLPYHSTTTFLTLLSILPANIPQSFKFLYPYIRSLVNPPRASIAQAATQIQEFYTYFNSYVLKVSEHGYQYDMLLSFWAGVITESVAARLDQARSGRSNVQLNGEEEVVRGILPTISKALSLRKVPQLQIGSYMIITVMVSKTTMSDVLLSSLMESVVSGWTQNTQSAGLICLAIIAQRRSNKSLSRLTTKQLLRDSLLVQEILNLSPNYKIDRLLFQFAMGVLSMRIEFGNLKVIQGILQRSILGETQTRIIIHTALEKGQQLALDASTESNTNLLMQYSEFLRDILASPQHQDIAAKLVEESNIDMDLLEMKLQTAIMPLREPELKKGDDSIKHIEASVAGETLDDMIAKIPIRSVGEVSFLASSKSHLFDQLYPAFLKAASTKEVARFEELPVLNGDQAFSSPLFFSFMVRIWSGPHPVLARSVALESLTKKIEAPKSPLTDMQGLIPYLLSAIADTSETVRRAAATAILVTSRYQKRGLGENQQPKTLKIWCEQDLYAEKAETSSVEWVRNSTDVVKFLDVSICPNLEECILDDNRIFSLIESCLRGSSGREGGIDSSQTKLKTSIRGNLLSFLASHALLTPIWIVKFNIIEMLIKVEKVGDVNRTKALLPVLKQWIEMSQEEMDTKAAVEKLTVDQLDAKMMRVVSSNQKDGLQVLRSIVDTSDNQRSGLVHAAIKQIQKLWPTLKTDQKISMSRILLDYGLTNADDNTRKQHRTEALAVLRTVELPVEVLSNLMSQIPKASTLKGYGKLSKKRKISDLRDSSSDTDGLTLEFALRKLNVILEIVDSSRPERYPTLLSSFFDILNELQQYKTAANSELAYLQEMVLSNMLAVLKTIQGSKASIDPVAVRVDLLVDCIRSTISTQVQNSALLVVAALAGIKPDLVLHSVMPIFTFMGDNVLKQDDDFSAHVVDKTIRTVIPPLVDSLRREKRDPVVGAADILLSFVAALQHMPGHRKIHLFKMLVETLGAQEFLFALSAMLADKYHEDLLVQNFVIELFTHYDCETQLITAIKYLEFIADVLSVKPKFAQGLLGRPLKDQEAKESTTYHLFGLLIAVLKQKTLGVVIRKSLRRDDQESSRLRGLFSVVFESILKLAQMSKAFIPNVSKCGELLHTVLGLLTTSELIKSVGILLAKPDDELRRKTLMAIETRLSVDESDKKKATTALLGFVPRLTLLIKESETLALKHIAIECVDKIAEKYGKKDVEVIKAASMVISSPAALSHSDDKIKVVSLLCLASVAEILQAQLIPLLPVALPSTLEHLEKSMQVGSENEKLHNASFAFLSALAEHVPWMITGQSLDRILQLCHQSAGIELDSAADEGRIELLNLLSRKIDEKLLLEAISRNWDDATNAGTIALSEHIKLFGDCVEKSPKSVVAKYSALLNAILLKGFDVRRHQSLAEEEVFDQEDIQDFEDTLNEVAIKIIYKLNDTTFRPVFVKTIEWATQVLPKKDGLGRSSRALTLFIFLSKFFDTLKSIVTSYASYIIDPAVEILNTESPQDQIHNQACEAVLDALKKTFENDQDEFWQSPAHFDKISPPLLAQLGKAHNAPQTEVIISTIVALAAAADSNDHHKELNAVIMKHMRSENPRVRLAALQCEEALTDRLGEDWLALLPEMLPFISELQEDDDEVVERETHRWIVKIEGVLGESLDSMLA